ncbi:hypothetical protein [Lacimicrobium alkaliphilum]|uniref:DUF3618 domain-containing protein n=1 Tax=Lacimicrobium alkaliphilum TaxID=1526571 RepID=A0ABQ1R1N1_9ALTE|nr:hypothetical protein [Lacimicrobium alkaliphilum]GGD51540.1 hypothetical protein GCM10011357_04320 [Lacimicrobium alkaliphilum]
MQPRQLNREIAQLAQQLPQQRLQLGAQTRAVTKAVHNRLSSPAALVVATLSGALLGWWLYHQDNTPSNNTDSKNTTTRKRLTAVVAWLRTVFTAYIIRTFV